MISLNALHYASLLKRSLQDHKGNAGNLVIIGGQPSMQGAIILAGISALNSGVGKVHLITLDYPSIAGSFQYPELMIHDGNEEKQFDSIIKIQPEVICIGNGLGMGRVASKWLEFSISYHVPIVIDADALNLIATNSELLKIIRKRLWSTVLTPHPGEMARMLKVPVLKIQLKRDAYIKQLIDLSNSIVVLKGQNTLIGMPNQDILTCQEGNPGMASAGMGDVLSGLIGSLITQGSHYNLDPWKATCLAVQLHSLAADMLVKDGIGPIGLRASELCAVIRSQINIHSKVQTLSVV